MVSSLKYVSKYIVLDTGVLKHIFIHATFVWPLRGKLWKVKMAEYSILIWFQILDPKIKIKRAKRSILTYLHTYLHTFFTYLLTYLLTYLHTYILIFTYLLTYLLTYWLTYLITHLFPYLFTYLFTYLYTYLHTTLL